MSGDSDGFFQGIYVGAGPYVSARTDTGIDPDLIQTLARVEEADDDLLTWKESGYDAPQ